MDILKIQKNQKDDPRTPENPLEWYLQGFFASRHAGGIMNDYGHIDDETPSLAISLYEKYILAPCNFSVF